MDEGATRAPWAGEPASKMSPRGRISRPDAIGRSPRASAAEPPPAEPPPARRPCLRCGAEMRDGGWRDLRTGGTSGTAILFFGNWAQAGEGTLGLHTFGCPACGQVDFQLPPSGDGKVRPNGTLW